MTDRSVRCVHCGFPVDQCECPFRREKAAGQINPWSSQPVKVAAVSDRPVWEFVPTEKTAEKHPDLYRIRVTGGWLYRLGMKSSQLTFVPER